MKLAIDIIVIIYQSLILLFKDHRHDKKARAGLNDHVKF